MTHPLFSILIVAYRSEAFLDSCVHRILEQDHHDYEVILHNNGCDSSSVNSEDPRLRWIGAGENIGFAAGNNRAAEVATGEWLVLINPDAFMRNGFLKAVSTAIASFPEVNRFAPLQIDAADSDRLDGFGDAVTWFGFPYRREYGSPTTDLIPETLDVFGPCGAAFVIRRDLYEALGGFDEDFFCYCEDADLNLRANLMGELCVTVPDAVIDHIGSATHSVRSDFAVKHGYRNRFWMYVKGFPLILLLLSLPVHLILSWVMGLKDVLTGQGLPVLEAMSEAGAGLGRMLVKRRQIQRQIRFGSLRLARYLTWNPFKILNRR